LKKKEGPKQRKKKTQCDKPGKRTVGKKGFRPPLDIEDLYGLKRPQKRPSKEENL